MNETVTATETTETPTDGLIDLNAEATDEDTTKADTGTQPTAEPQTLLDDNSGDEVDASKVSDSDFKVGEFDASVIPEQFVKDKTVDVEKLAKSYSELRTKMDQKILDNVPEEYEIEDVMKECGLVWANEDQKNEVLELFKTSQMSNDAVESVLRVYADRMAQVMSQYGPPVNTDDESKKLQQMWGTDLQKNKDAVSKFAKTLPPEILTVPLHKTAAGLKFLHDLMNAKKGPDFIDSDISGVDVRDLEADLEQLLIAKKKAPSNSDTAKRLEREAMAKIAQIEKLSPQE